ncbi:hypothetical protein Rta_30230 [Ramlibacter tataouinensis TTB310]|uniref:Uncharacterized protein n=1 Tax=Ramlibacter tataouinensis (strain ATCC BAA-407 / DSM 14655 / LMG 21543 / TTB310) TaxID=365046 RepID=F5XW29_RAMTT|nr:hypothetical protein Rta_30230 [Ramlibacter tataouinensis TTB310]
MVDLPELAQDPRFATTRDRAAHQEELKSLLEERFKVRPTEHWIAAFARAGVPHARINDYAAALSDPQVAHMDWLQAITLPSGHATRTFASPVRLDGRGFAICHRLPALGEHSAEIRRELEQPVH